MGGIGNYILSLSKALKEKGALSIVASSGGDLETEFKKYGIELKRLDIKTKSEIGPKVLKSIVQLCSLIKGEDVDILHAHTRVSQVVCFFASRITGVPYVTTCHGFFKKRLRKIFDTWGSMVIAISEAVKTHLKEDLGVEEDRIELIYSGIDLNKFSKEYSIGEINKMKESLGLKGGPIVGTIGRLSPVKGQRFLVEAMLNVILKREDVEAIIIGDGPEERALKDLAKSLGIEWAIHFFGSDPDAYKFLSVMDIFVFPSIKEGLGIAMLEAMASGKACVASDIGGISDIVKDGFNGILVKVGDIDAIASAVISLLENAELRKKIGENAQALVKQRFSLNSMADNIIQLYRKIIGEEECVLVKGL